MLLGLVLASALVMNQTSGSSAGRIPAGIELSESEILHALIPDYELYVSEAADHPDDSARSTFYAQPCAEDENQPGFFNLPCSRQIESFRKCSPVEIQSVERWVVRGGTLKRISLRSRRIDHARSEIFPFALPVRSAFFRRPASPSVSTSIEERRPIQSPDRDLLLELDTTHGRFEVSILQEGRHLRTVRLDQGDAFDGHPLALGWSSDSRRFFVVVRFGLAEDRALLSFSVQGHGDFWEGLLTDDSADYENGFVLEPTKPVAKRSGKKPGKS